MDGLAERLAELEAKSLSLGKCALAKLMHGLDAESQAILDRLLRNELVSTRSITIELASAGLKIDRHSVTAHRTGRCVCRKDESND